MISVVMPVYNGAKTIADALASVLANQHQNLEIIVVDDCSTDTTRDVVLCFAEKDPRIKLLQTPFNMGPGGARNIALNAVRGEWVTLIDADDMWAAGRASSLLHAAESLHADVVLDNHLLFDHALNKISGQTRFAGADKPALLTPKNFFRFDNLFQTPIFISKWHNSIGYSQPFMRTDFLVRHNIRYLTKYRVHEDILFLTDMVMAGAKIVVLPYAFYIYRLRTSPATGKASPFSHTKSSTQANVQVCDEIIEKYREKLSSRVLGQLRRRKKYLSAMEKQKSLRATGAFFSAFGMFFKEPLLIAVKMSNPLKKIIELFSTR